MWHTLSASLLDEEKRVREALLCELGLMLTGKGAYAVGGSPQPANLRFLAMLVLCVDSDGNAIANGNAAHVGKASHAVKSAAKIGVVGLRQTTEATLNQCRAVGKDAEMNFDQYLKKKIMPEYSVPFAIHLLSFRRETPSAGGIVAGMPGSTQLAAIESSDEDVEGIDDSAHQKSLRKRLRWLFEPLVLSLGDSADNISFLLRMTEMIGNQFQPRPINGTTSSLVLSGNNSDDSFSSPVLQSNEDTRMTLPTAKMKTTCAAARDVLLTFVKKDVNLTPYPGKIDVPTSVFQKLTLSSIKAVHKQIVDVGTPVMLRSVRHRPDSLSEKKRPLSSVDGEMAESRVRESEDDNNPDTPRLTRSRRTARESIDSLPSAGTSEKSTKRIRASIDSTSSASNTLVASQDSRDSLDRKTEPARRKSRVTFSPQIVHRSQDVNCGSSQSPTSFGGMSPIVMSDSPASLTANSLRMRLSDVEMAPTNRQGSSLDTEEDEVENAVQERGINEQGRPRLARQAHRQLLSSQESATTTPETQSSFDDHNSPRAVQRSILDRGNRRPQRTKMPIKVAKAKSKKPDAVKIKVGHSQSSSDSTMEVRRGSRFLSRRALPQMTTNEFDFSDDLDGAEKENVPRKRGKVADKSKGGNKMKRKTVKEAALAGTKPRRTPRS
ncbi:mitotic sister chromatid cohesion [Fragilaria crotonensis]|nr:mitotic sister chromatid cohesion [Fragilaria crotonensis]